MASYKPSLPFNVPMYVLTPIYSKVKCVTVKKYPEPTDDNLFYGSFKTFGGTESESNGVLTVLDTASIETWYRPDITSGCQIKLVENNKVYEVIGEPENINMRNQFMKFKVQRVTGGA